MQLLCIMIIIMPTRKPPVNCCGTHIADILTKKRYVRALVPPICYDDDYMLELRSEAKASFIQLGC